MKREMCTMYALNNFHYSSEIRTGNIAKMVYLVHEALLSSMCFLSVKTRAPLPLLDIENTKAEVYFITSHCCYSKRSSSGR
jgi:hypothetical protein